MIEARAVVKRYGEKTAVDGLTFTAEPGRVTGFLGPNGAGKSTTMRMMVGLDRPTSGEVVINGRSYADHPAPLHEVGALLEARAIHPGRSARNHLLALAATAGIGRARVEAVLELVGLSEVAHRRVSGYSLGMGQRLGVAAALLGDPATLVLDEPVNGLDLDGIRWIRSLLTRLAGEGRTVLLSSHLMSEMAVTADQVVVIGRGALLRDQSMADFIAEATDETVRVASADDERLAEELRAEGGEIDRPSADGDPATGMEVRGLPGRRIGELAARAGIVLWELAPQQGSLEAAYLALTRDSLDYRETTPDTELSGTPGTPGTPEALGSDAESAS